MIKENGCAATGEEQSDLTRAAGEYMFSGLRLTAGVSLKAFAARFGKSMLEFYPAISSWVSEGLMEIQDEHVHLTHRGLMVANSVFVQFV